MDRLLARVRDALGAARPVPAPAPPGPSGAAVAADLVAAFAAALEAADGRLEHAPDEAAARRLVAARWPGAALVEAGDAPDEERIRQAEIGLDVADVLVAETGTVVRSYTDRRAARVALVPPVSVFLAPRAALVRDLPEALARVAPTHADGRAYTVLITGPSRTADIEKRLVIPAHGPREVLVVLYGDEGLESGA